MQYSGSHDTLICSFAYSRATPALFRSSLSICLSLASSRPRDDQAPSTTDKMVAPAGFEPAISALKGRRPGPLDDGATHRSISIGVPPPHAFVALAPLPAVTRWRATRCPRTM